MTHRLRTFLTMLGIIIGVSSVIAMSAFSLGSKQKQADQIRALGVNLVRVVDRRLENERLTAARVQGSAGLSRADLTALRRSVTGIRLAASAREIKLNVLFEGQQLSPRVLGVAGDYPAVNNLRLAAGRWLDARDHERAAAVAIVGSAVADAIGKNGGGVGSRLLIGGGIYTVVGTLANKHIELADLEASAVADPNHDIFIPLPSLLARTTQLDLRGELDEIQLQLADEEAMTRVARAIRRVLEARHHGVDDFDLVIPMDLLKQKQQSQRLLDILTICISSVSVVVGGIGIMNIMLASVTERIREIGVRRAVGATRIDILLQFLAESVLIAWTGGILGVGLAAVVVITACRALDLPVVFAWPLVVFSVAAATVTGLIFGIYPAYRAAARNPVESLRYE